MIAHRKTIIPIYVSVQTVRSITSMKTKPIVDTCISMTIRGIIPIRVKASIMLMIRITKSIFYYRAKNKR